MTLTRIEIEAKLNRDRAWLIEALASLPEDDLVRPATRSEHDAGSWWTIKDHVAHLSLIEHNFVRMVRRYLDGHANPVGLRERDDGTPRSREEIMASVHEMTEAWAIEHRDSTLNAVIALGQRSRSETLALLAELTDEQLAEPLPGAPWSDGTVGGVLAVNADHGRMHWKWAKDGLAGHPSESR